jgi:sulfatase maturation enzyme AslB (radical SAM superfamily)
MKEDYDLNHSSTSYTKYSENMRRFYQSYEEDSPFWNDLESNLSDIRQFDFYGGEPFLSKKMWHILSICVEKGYAKDIEIHFNTNGTIWPEDKIECFQYFKEVNLSFSIDGIEKQFEYMRFLADWSVVLSNMKTARDFSRKYGNMNISWCITLSTLNIFDLPETLDFYYENFNDFGLYLNLVHGPIHYNISTLPDQIKDKIVEHINKSVSKDYQQAWMYIDGILSFMKNGIYDKNAFKKLKELTLKHDHYRKQSYSEIFPQACKVLGL